MVSKCANPGCSAPFLYLRQGKLFRIEMATAEGDSCPIFGADPTVRRQVRRLEFFWLCDDCAPRMTLTFKEKQGVVVQPMARVAVAAAL